MLNDNLHNAKLSMLCSYVLLKYFSMYIALSLLSASTQVRFVNVLDTVSFSCEVSGVPLPFVNWSVSAERISISAIPSSRALVTTMTINDNTIMSILTISSVQLDDAGVYICTAINGENSDQAFYDVRTGTFVCIF